MESWRNRKTLILGRTDMMGLVTPAEYVACVEPKRTMQHLVCARVRARHGVLLVERRHDVGIRPDIAKPSQGPAPLRSQDSGRRLCVRKLAAKIRA
jgi:hypothetical protein